MRPSAFAADLSPSLGPGAQPRFIVAVGVVGGLGSTGQMQYSIFGDTVNTASRMESHGVPEKIHISKVIHQDLGNH